MELRILLGFILTFLIGFAGLMEAQMKYFSKDLTIIDPTTQSEQLQGSEYIKIKSGLRAGQIYEVFQSARNGDLNLNYPQLARRTYSLEKNQF